MQQRKWLLIVGAFALILIGLIIKSWPDNRLKIIFCDVGQGDASLIVLRNFQMLIDGGPSESKVYKCLSDNMPFWDRRIEVMVNTHPEADHINGLLGVAKRYKVEKLLVSGWIDQEGKSEQLRRLVGANKVKEVRVGDSLRYSDLYFDIVWTITKDELEGVGRSETDSSFSKEINRSSVVGLLRFKNFTSLFTGDITEDEELAIAHEGMLRKVDVLKIAHHGSKTSSNITFLDIIKPKMAVVSVGKNNSFGHPTAEVVSRIDTVRASLWRTDRQGYVKIICDGEKYEIESQFPKSQR